MSTNETMPESTRLERVVLHRAACDDCGWWGEPRWQNDDAVEDARVHFHDVHEMPVTKDGF